MHEPATTPPALPHLVPEAVVRERFGVSRSTLWRWRKTGTGPKCYQLGPRLMYDPADLAVWLEDQRADAPRAA